MNPKEKMVSEVNKALVATIPAFLEGLVSAVEKGTYGYDLRTQIKEIRIVPEQGNNRRAMVGLVCEGLPTQAVYLELDEDEIADEIAD